MKDIKYLLIDADDTLWDNNVYYERASQAFFHLCEKNGLSRELIEQDFLREEKNTVQTMGYGSKSYLTILETLYIRYLKLPGSPDLQSYLNIISEFKVHISNAPVLFDHVAETLRILVLSFELYLLTKGNHEEQWNKINRSGLLPLFQSAFVEPEKMEQTYRRILKQKKWEASQVCMIGNSPRSDINPALRTGMYAVFIPYKYSWAFDDEALPEKNPRLQRIESFRRLPQILLPDDYR